MRAAEMSSFQGGRHGGFFGGGSLGLGGGMNNPSLLLTAPLLEGGSGRSAPPSPACSPIRPSSKHFRPCRRTSKTTCRAVPGRRTRPSAPFRTTWTRFARERFPARPPQPRFRLTRPPFSRAWGSRRPRSPRSNPISRRPDRDHGRERQHEYDFVGNHVDNHVDVDRSRNPARLRQRPFRAPSRRCRPI